VYLATENPVLCYNLLFLSTFVLSGLGMYLFVRELTGHAAAAFVAGLVFAFVPYRLSQSSHLQVLSAQWMPFALYGFRRYFDTGRWPPLAGAALALLAQNLSCGYYLLYFSPFAAAYVIWEISRRGLWANRRVWMQLSAAAIAVAVLAAPFLLPYARIRDDLQAERSSVEVSRFSADVYSYATAYAGQRVWGRVMRAFPKLEGDLFPGLVPVVLALIGIVARRGQAGRKSPPYADTAPSRIPHWLPVGFAAVAVAHGIAAAITIVLRRVSIDTGLFVLRISNITQLLIRAAVAAGLLLVVSPSARVRMRSFIYDRGFFVLALVAAAWLSLGPAPQALGRPLEIAAPYRLLFDHVPGFEGLRVPARFAMITMLMLAILAGYGAAAVGRTGRGRLALAVLGAAFLIEATHVPFLVNGMTPLRGFETPEARVYRPARAPVIYREVARQAPSGVLVELPLGSPDYDLRAMYYSIAHWRPLVNGYSGFYPAHYDRLRFALSELPRHPGVSWQALQASGATHVIVHESAYLGAEGANTTTALLQLGAVELFREGPDALLALPPE
jgi:hypothetical protein